MTSARRSWTCRCRSPTSGPTRTSCARVTARRGNPRIAKALWRETLIDAAIFREWTVNVGRREAYSRIAHILCELTVRLQAVGLTQDHTCKIPITQSEFADATGLSNVHVNRVLQELRADGLILLKGDTLQVLDWDQLKQAGDFDATYLHLQRKQEAA